jgi:N-acetylmuramoyl-L-alanine amidase CwlA
MTINKLLTKTNFRKVSNKQNKYIVIHYVGATGGAKDNCRYFETEYRGASAHYFVGHSGEIWQCVEDKYVAWHCGATTYKHPYCRNDNSIGIEMCCRKDSKGVWYFEDATVSSTIGLVKELMKKYNIPAENVIRHYDVMGKNCPAPYVLNNTKHTWNDFKAQLKKTTATANNTVATKGENEVMAKDNKPDAYAEEAIKWAVDKGILKGTTEGDYKLHSAVSRQDMLVFLYRAIG